MKATAAGEVGRQGVGREEGSFASLRMTVLGGKTRGGIHRGGGGGGAEGTKSWWVGRGGGSRGCV
jgi:hypothetical protein